MGVRNRACQGHDKVNTGRAIGCLATLNHTPHLRERVVEAAAVDTLLAAEVVGVRVQPGSVGGVQEGERAVVQSTL